MGKKQNGAWSSDFKLCEFCDIMCDMILTTSVNDYQLNYPDNAISGWMLQPRSSGMTLCTLFNRNHDQISPAEIRRIEF